MRLDVRALARRNLLAAGWFSWHWNDGHTGDRVGSIGIAADGQHLRLSYTVNGSPAGDMVPIVRTACTLGGTRPWLACPRCERRAAVLNLRGGRFICGPCAGLVYASQSEDEIGRTWRRQRKLEGRLGDDWTRPKGMHRATHARLMAAVLDCDRRRDHAITAFMERRGLIW